MLVRTRARKSGLDKMQSPRKRTRSDQARTKLPREVDSPLANRIRKAEEAIRRRDEAAILGMAIQSLERSATLLAETVADRRRSLKEMASVEKRIDRTQAETARMLNRLVNGDSRI